MCTTCEALGALLLAEKAEADLLAADVADGLAHPGAARALFNHERRAQVRFADLDVDEQQATAEAAEIMAELHLLIGGVIIVALFGEDRSPRTPAQVIAALDALTVAQPEAVREAVEAAAERLGQLYSGAYAQASERVVQEAVRQGAGAVAAPRAATPDTFAPIAAATAAHPWRRIAGKVQEELSKPAVLAAATISPQAVEDVLAGIRPAGSVDAARQAIHTATGMGRIETAEEMEPAEIWASEILDGQGCTPCSHVDGKDYASLADARLDYPVAGYAACEGGSRCRGTLAFVFADA